MVGIMKLVIAVALVVAVAQEVLIAIVGLFTNIFVKKGRRH